MTWLKAAARTTVTAAVVLCFCALVALGIGPRLLGYRTLTVLTGSMRPAAPAGSLVVATAKPVSQLGVGDVLVYEAPLADRRVVSHRVVSLTSPSRGVYVVQTKGDDNAAPDPWLSQIDDSRVWTVRAVLPGLGGVVRFLRGKLIHVALIYGIPALLAMMWLSEIWRRHVPVELPAAHA